LLTTCQHALTVLADGEESNLQSQLYAAKQLVSELVGMDSKLSGYSICSKKRLFSLAKPRTNCAIIMTASISIRTACLSWSSVSPANALARKHQITPEELPDLYQSLLEEQRMLDDSAGSLESLAKVVEHHQLALDTAKQLHALRQNSADELTQLITESMHSLSMPHGVFAIDVAFDERHPRPKAQTISNSASPLTRVSRCSRLLKLPPAASCRVLRWRFRSSPRVKWKLRR
jgi:DNA repair protein RecN (Recombination protein N)